jgi:hypothetical protein
MRGNRIASSGRTREAEHLTGQNENHGKRLAFVKGAGGRICSSQSKSACRGVDATPSSHEPTAHNGRCRMPGDGGVASTLGLCEGASEAGSPRELVAADSGRGLWHVGRMPNRERSATVSAGPAAASPITAGTWNLPTRWSVSMCCGWASQQPRSEQSQRDSQTA